MDSAERDRRVRWRMILGSGAEDVLGKLEGEAARRDRALEYLYGREYGAGRNTRPSHGPNRGEGSGDPNSRSTERRGGLGPSQLTIPDWINEVHELFPANVIERIEADALHRYKIEEMVLNPEVMERAQPNESLLRSVLQMKHLMNQETLAVARAMVRKVVEQLMRKLARTVQRPFLGTRDRRRRSFLKVAKNFDAKTTIRRNLKRFDPETRRLSIETPYFNSRTRRDGARWQIIILVDQSGSMAMSVIYSAVTASIFHGISSLKTHLIAFDTEVVDLTSDCSDPVELLMKVQLGGGTDIGRALTHAQSLIDNPRKTIVVLISDFMEGGSEALMLSAAKSIVESGAKLLGLAALDERAAPAYDESMARRLAALGASVGAMTPGELAAWVAEAAG